MEHVGAGSHRNSPNHNSEVMLLRGQAENTPWSAQNPQARRGDPRLGPSTGPLYGKSAVQSGLSVVNARPPDIAQPVNWTSGSEIPVQPSSTAQQSTVTPGLFTAVSSYLTLYTLGSRQFKNKLGCILALLL